MEMSAELTKASKMCTHVLLFLRTSEPKFLLVVFWGMYW